MPSSARKTTPKKAKAKTPTPRKQPKRGVKDSADSDSPDGDRDQGNDVSTQQIISRGDPNSVDALSELKSLLELFPPETLQALVTKPLTVTRPLLEEERRSASAKLLDWVDSDLYDQMVRTPNNTPGQTKYTSK